MKTKILLFSLSVLFLISLFNFTSLYAQWKACNNGLGQYGVVTRCFIKDGNYTFVGIKGGIFMTTDNGDNWIAKNNGLKGYYGIDILSLAINGNVIFAGTELDGIYMSTDKGDHWVLKGNGLPHDSYSFVYKSIIYSIIINGNKVIAGTSKGIYVSTDNGNNWIAKNNGLPIKDSLPVSIHSIITNGNKIFAVPISSTFYGVYMTTDDGDSWITKNNGLTNIDVELLTINGNDIFACTFMDGIFLSTNNGDSWKNFAFKDTIVDIIYIYTNNIFAASGYEIYLSTDYGNSWFKYLTSLEAPYIFIQCVIINGNYIFLGTISSGVYRARLSDLGITDVKEPTNYYNNGFEIFPNPASSSVSVKYESANYSKLQISIFDLLGNEVISSSEDCNIGLNEKVIDCHSLETGYYIVRLKQGERVEAKPVLIVRN